MLVGVGTVVITRSAVPVVVAEKVTADASTDSLEACDCNPEIWVETLVFSHLLRKSCRSDSRRFKFGTWWSIEYVIIHCWQAPQFVMNGESATHEVVELKVATFPLHDAFDTSVRFRNTPSRRHEDGKQTLLTTLRLTIVRGNNSVQLPRRQRGNDNSRKKHYWIDLTMIERTTSSPMS